MTEATQAVEESISIETLTTALIEAKGNRDNRDNRLGAYWEGRFPAECRILGIPDLPTYLYPDDPRNAGYSSESPVREWSHHHLGDLIRQAVEEAGNYVTLFTGVLVAPREYVRLVEIYEPRLIELGAASRTVHRLLVKDCLLVLSPELKDKRVPIEALRAEGIPHTPPTLTEEEIGSW